jgi:tetratricopeptide (TPR) repeat protein
LAILLAGCDMTTIAEKQQPKQPSAASTQKKTQGENKAPYTFDDPGKEEARKSEILQGYLKRANEYWMLSQHFETKKDERVKLLQNAEAELNYALEINPRSATALHTRSAVYIELGKLNEAEMDLKLLIEIDPKNDSAYYNLACLYSIAKKLDLSAEALNAALQNGFRNMKSLRDGPELVELRKTRKFQQILDQNRIFIPGY